MAEKEKVYKVVKDQITTRVRIAKLLGRERAIDLMNGKEIEVNKSELDLMKINSWVTLKKDKIQEEK